MDAPADGMEAPAGDRDDLTCHATCVVLGEAGVLIRGGSGSGKSSLALALLDRVALAGLFGALVADDRVRVSARHGRLVARAHPAIAGRIEVRGLGIVDAHAVPACILRLVVDLVAALPRMPDDAGTRTAILGIDLPKLALDRAMRDAGLAPSLVLRALSVASQPHIAADRNPAGAGP